MTANLNTITRWQKRKQIDIIEQTLDIYNIVMKLFRTRDKQYACEQEQ